MKYKISSLIVLVLLTVFAPFAHAGSYGFPQRAEDAASANGNNLMPAGGVRNDTRASQTSTDGDYGVFAIDAASRQVVVVDPNGVATYSVSSLTFNPVVSPTNIFTITGSGTKTIEILQMGISVYTATGAGQSIFYLKKYSTAASGGTSTTLNPIPTDSNAAAATASVKIYTANPTVGTLVNTDGRMTSINAVPTVTANLDAYTPRGYMLWDSHVQGAPIVLNGTSQYVAIDLNGTTISGTGAAVACWAIWRER